MNRPVRRRRISGASFSQTLFARQRCRNLRARLQVCEDIGIVPIFEYLRRAALSDIRLGVLSGSLVIIPSSAETILRQAATGLGIEPQDLSISPLSHDPDYSSVEIRGEYYRGSVRLITSVFQQGGITVLVGTKSLLGEGWDAPCINTLVLASFVGSFVLSNQMRGRSIRVDSAQPQKTAISGISFVSSRVYLVQVTTMNFWFGAAPHSPV